ncbi:MAG: dTMP kinase [Eubacteriales bacterium]
MEKGLFITFEGADGSGKSTQAKFLAEGLEGLGFDVLLTREPGGCPVAEKIRDIVLDKDNVDILDITEAYLYAASRAQHVHQVIMPALEAGKIVVCDRFIHSSVAYQGYGRDLGKERVLEINKHAVDGCLPDITFFITMDPERAFDRMNKQKERDRLETQEQAFYDRLFQGYLKILEDEKDSIIPIDAKGTKYETKEIVLDKAKAIFKEKGLL